MKQSLTILILLLFATLAAYQPGTHLPHGWSTEELMFRDWVGRDFYPTDPPPGPVRPVAEFEPMSGVLIRYDNGFQIHWSLIENLAEITQLTTIASSTSQMNSCSSAYTSHGIDPSQHRFLIAPTNSIWTRDYGPWFIFDGNDELAVVNFMYNRPRPDDDDIPIEFAALDSLSLYGMSLEQTGGNYMTDGLGIAAQTTLVWAENGGMSHDQIGDMMGDYLGVETHMCLPDPLADYIEHIDCWGKFLDVDKVLIGQVPQSDPRYDDYEYVADYFANHTSSWGTPFEVFRVMSPGGYSQPTPYTNSLIINDHVFVPQTGSSHDAAALQVYEDAMPGYTIVGVMYGGWMDTDALHCRTHELPDKHMLYVHHIPVTGEIVPGNPIPVTAHIHPYSGANLIADSLLVHYRTDDTQPWETVVLQDIGNEQYSAEMPGQPAGAEVQYYISAADESGKHANHPYIGAPDPHRFTTAEDTQAPELEHAPIGDITVDDVPLTIATNAWDNVGVTEVIMTWRIDEGDEYELYLEPQDAPLWSGLFEPELSGSELIEYRLDAFDGSGNTCTIPLNGWFSFSVAPVSVEDDDTLPGQTMLIGTAPNPFRTSAGQVGIRYFAAKEKPLQIGIYNIRGQKVHTLRATPAQPGENTILWNARDSEGKSVPTGVYLLRMESGESSRFHKLMILK